MSNALEGRLRDAKTDLTKVGAALVKQTGTGKLPPDVETQFTRLAAFRSDVDNWIGMLDARSAARQLLTDLESQADPSDTVPLGGARAKYQHVRLIGVQAYLATRWALADTLVAMVGQIVCTPDAAFNAIQPAQLVNEFVRKERKRNTSAALHDSVRLTFGWPIAVSYALRNHFVHEGGLLAGVDFFDGPTAASRFAISIDGWSRVEARAKTYGVDPSHHRAGAAWPAVPRADLRAVLDVCERETDDALGVLVGSACRSLVTHLGYMIGEV